MRPRALRVSYASAVVAASLCALGASCGAGSLDSLTCFHAGCSDGGDASDSGSDTADTSLPMEVGSDVGGDASDGGCAAGCGDGFCAADGTCHAPVVLTTMAFKPQGIAVQAGNVYWANTVFQTAVVGNCPTTGCGSTLPDFVKNSQCLALLAVDQSGVYWGDLTGTIMRCTDPTGCMFGQTVIPGLVFPYGVALLSGNVYFTDQEAGTVGYCPVGGCLDASILATGQDQPGDIAVTDAGAFWVTMSADGGVSRCSLPGGPMSVTPFALGQQMPVSVAVDGANVYWTTSGTGGSTGAVQYCPLSGCAPTPVAIASMQPGPAGLDLDVGLGALYWADSVSGQILTCPATAGCTPSVLARNQGNPSNITHDATNLYWTNRQGSVMKLAK
jgi:hypothetical protein